MSKTPLINIFTSQLPYKLSNQIYNEFESRLREAKYIMDLSDLYRPLLEHLDTIEILLAMTIFQKRVISNLDAAIKFHGTVMNYSNSEIVKIGKYKFTLDEKNLLLSLTISYEKLQKKYGIPNSLVDYTLTKEFLRKCLFLLNDNFNGQEDLTGEFGEENETDFNEDDLPF